MTMRSTILCASVLLLTSSAARAQQAKPESKEAQKRRQILQGLGLKKKDTPPPPPAPPILVPAEPEAPPAAPGGARDGARPNEAPSPLGFAGAVHATLVRSCATCHVAGGPAGATRLVLSGDVSADHASVRKVVDVAKPDASALVLKGTGAQPHGGGASIAPGGREAELLLRWIAAGATLGRSTAAPPPVVAAPKPPVLAPAPPVSRPAPVAAPVAPTASAPAAATPVAQVDHAARAHEVMVRACGLCHAPGAPAGVTRFVLEGNVEPDLTLARDLVDVGKPEASLLVTKGAGEAHQGGAILGPTTDGYAVLIAWIRAGAPTGAAVAPPLVATPGAPPPPSAPSQASVGLGRGPAAPAAHYGISLIGGLRLNGRFDMNYERRGLQDHPFGDGKSALRSYHQFLFLSREAADDPFGFTAEIVNLTFYEANVRVSPKTVPWRAWLSFGKLLVPFGTEPLFHQFYGGLAGFDQRVVPIIWSAEGAAFHWLAPVLRDARVTWDLYAIRGYALKRSDAVLNLQADFSPSDDVRVGVGQRLGAYWGPISAWYSAMWNPLGFGRTLFLQALDLAVWRPHGLPVLDRFVVGAGALRADVSGGGPGQDYFHFASYLQLRYYPLPFVYLQYRQGLRTFDNRRGGLIGDETRWTAQDGSTHNFGLVGRYRGLTLGVFWFFLLEKADEVRDDFLRVSAAFEF